MRAANQYRAIRPINTSPNHEAVLALCDGLWRIATRHGALWITEHGTIVQPTHWAELPPIPLPEAKRMGHPRTCECGECRKCIMREYTRAWRNKRKETTSAR